MKKTLDDALCKTFPKIFRDRHGDMTETCMCWGFDCRDGWFDLLYECCSKLQRICDEKNVQVIATQVKEKYGTLHFYFRVEQDLFEAGSEESDDIWDSLDAVVSLAEDKSGKTCEICGKPGKSNSTGWIRTRCKKHSKE